MNAQEIMGLTKHYCDRCHGVITIQVVIDGCGVVCEKCWEKYRNILIRHNQELEVWFKGGLYR